MKNLLSGLAVALLAFGFAGGANAAGNVTDADVRNFVKALPDVENFSETLRKEGKDKALSTATQPVPGEKDYRPYSKGVTLMKEKFPEEYKELGAIITRHGFSSQENWAEVSDNVMLAYMALKIEDQNPKALEQMRNIPKETKKQMPPETLAQIEQSLALMEIFSAAPAENKAVVKPHIGEINAWLDRSAAEEKKAAAAKSAPKEAEKPRQ